MHVCNLRACAQWHTSSRKTLLSKLPQTVLPIGDQVSKCCKLGGTFPIPSSHSRFPENWGGGQASGRFTFESHPCPLRLHLPSDFIIQIILRASNLESQSCWKGGNVHLSRKGKKVGLNCEYQGLEKRQLGWHHKREKVWLRWGNRQEATNLGLTWQCCLTQNLVL